jgi:hypothetical protein
MWHDVAIEVAIPVTLEKCLEAKDWRSCAARIRGVSFDSDGDQVVIPLVSEALLATLVGFSVKVTLRSAGGRSPAV